MKQFYLLFFCICLFIFSCRKKEKYAGYTETGSGLYFKILSIGDNKNAPRKGDFLELKMSYRTMNDSLFLDSRRTGSVFIPYSRPSFTGSFEEKFVSMSEGDSASFIVNADSVFNRFLNLPIPFFLQPGESVKINLRIEKVLSQSAYEHEMALQKEKLEDRDMEEQAQISRFMEKNYPDISPIEPGLYYIPFKEGNGAAAESGKTVTVRYEGTFLDGKIFDDAYRRAALDFTIGEQQQVISGFEKGIRLMKEGGKAKFIISSQLAFGEQGSSTGIVPPYTSVVYEVELLKVK